MLKLTAKFNRVILIVSKVINLVKYMATLTIDTHKFITQLKDAGVEEKQAEAIVNGIKDINLEHVATKEDIAELKADLFKWLIPILLGQIAVFAAVVKLLIA